MNEQIKEFAIESGLPTALDYHQRRYEKFAELIIRECIYIVENTSDRYRKEYFANKIKQHFGVEE